MWLTGLQKSQSVNRTSLHSKRTLAHQDNDLCQDETLVSTTKTLTEQHQHSKKTPDQKTTDKRPNVPCFNILQINLVICL